VTAGGLVERRDGSRKVRTPQGKDAGATQAAKADGKWNRKETAGRCVHGSVGKGETVG
jgi:hypothetical protein